ncbi:MAG: CPBP family intramembrane metalloprotease [Oscillospiraceae bacterium]|nr:CPBP family intramembrane metalloprotease [Oscillospiraceae bacterium]
MGFHVWVQVPPPAGAMPASRFRQPKVDGIPMPGLLTGLQEELELGENDIIITDNNNDLKRQEISSFKKLLYLLSFTVIAVAAAQWLFVLLINKGIGLYIASLPTVPLEEAAGTEYTPMSGAAENVFYFLIWFINHFVIFMPSLIIFGLAFRKKLGFEKAGIPYEFNTGWVLPVFLASYALSVIASYISQILAWILQPVFGTGELPDVFADVMPQSGGQVIIMLFMVGLVGPVLEELIYRHLLLRPLRRYGDFQAVVITALLFAFFHGNVTQFLYTFTGGIIYGVVAVKMNSVKPVIILHIINNVYVILFDWISNHPQTDQTLLTLSWGGMVLAGAVILIYFLAKKRFNTENYNPHIPAAERVRIIAENPLVLLMFAVLIAETVTGF